MKNFFLLFVVMSFFSCSSSDDSSSNSTARITPPNWIQGTWLLKGSPVVSGFRFTSDDFCQIVMTSTVCNKESIELYKGTQINTNVRQEISDTYYLLEITISSIIQTHRFEKVSATEIRWLDNSADAIFTKK